MRNFTPLLSVILLFLLGSCAGPTGSSYTTETISSETMATASSPIAIDSLLKASPIVHNTKLPTLTPSPVFVPEHFPGSASELRDDLIEFLNDRTRRPTWAASDNLFNFTTTVRSVDLNKDDLADIVFVFQMWNQGSASKESNDLPDGGVLVLIQKNGDYTVVYEIHGGWLGGEATIEGILDLNGDTLPEIVIRYPWGGSGCEVEYQVISLVQGEYVNILSPYGSWECDSYLVLLAFDDGEIVFDFRGTPSWYIPVGERVPSGGSVTFLQEEPWVEFKPMYE